MAFVDGVVIPVPVANKSEFKNQAKVLARLFMDCGALEVVDAWGQDVPDGEVTSFPMAVQRESDEAVVFSWITWPDRATREAGWEKAMKDARMAAFPSSLFDGKRMIFGGFDVIQSTRKGD